MYREQQALQPATEYQKGETQKQDIDLDYGSYDAFGCAGLDWRCKSRNGDISAAFAHRRNRKPAMPLIFPAALDGKPVANRPDRA